MGPEFRRTECAGIECGPAGPRNASMGMLPVTSTHMPLGAPDASRADNLPDISFPAYMQAVYTGWCLVLLVVGLVGNLLVPLVVVRDRELRGSSTSVFIVNLVAADLLVLVVCLPALISELFAPPAVWVLPVSMCKVVPYVEFTVAHASMLTILAISVERYRAICHPLTVAASCTRLRAALTCLLVWVIATSLTSPVIALTEHRRVRYIDESLVPVCYTRADKPWAQVFVVSSMVGLFFLPLVVLVGLYWRIARQLLLEDQQLCRDKPNPHLQARKQVVVMLGTVVVAFFICLLPYRIFSLWFIFTTKESEQSIGQETYYNLLYAFRVLVYVNSAINPVLYNVTSSKFRGAFFRLLGVGSGEQAWWWAPHAGVNTGSSSCRSSSTATSLTKAHAPWRSQRLVVRCSYTCLQREGETCPLVPQQPVAPAVWGTVNPAQTPSGSPFLARSSCTRDAVRQIESFV